MPNDKDIFRQMIAFSDACESSESYRIVSEAQKGTIETAGALPGLLGPLTLLVARFPPQSHLIVALLF